MTVMLICICAINIWIQNLIFVILYLASPSERIMLYTSIFFFFTCICLSKPFSLIFSKLFRCSCVYSLKKSLWKSRGYASRTFFSFLVVSWILYKGKSSVNNNIPKNNKHGQYKCNKNALVLTICQKRSTKAETVNKQNRFRSINYVLSMMSKLIFYHGKWPLHEISTMDVRLQPRVNMSRYISRELLS